MATAPGPIGNPRFATTDPAKFSANLTDLSNFVANSFGGSVSDYTDLASVSNMFPGMRVWVVNDAAAWTFNGSGWKRTPGTVQKVHTIYDQPTGGTVATGTTLASFTIAALPYSTTLSLDGNGNAGFRGVSGISVEMIWASNAGTLSQAATRSNTATVGVYTNITKKAWLALPPNTAATVTLKTVSSDTLFWTAVAELEQEAA